MRGDKHSSSSKGAGGGPRAGLTRRSLLQKAGGALALSAIPFRSALPLPAAAVPAAADSGSSVSPVMARLSAYMSEAADRPLPDDVTGKMKEHILDTFAAMISGSDLPPGKQALRFAGSYGGEKIATVAASTIVCGPMEAALVNGLLAHSDETDDSHAPSQCHPGCAIVPGALAAAERFGISGTHFVRAATLGYDVGPRFTMTLGAIEFMAETHRSTYGIAGTFGAAAAAACAARLDAQRMRWVIDYASQESSGIATWQRDTDHMEKGFAFAGMPARNGVTAALLVQSGLTGIDDALSGADNFFLANNPKADPAGLIDKLGERYEVTRTNIKKWTVGSPIQAVLDAIENLQKRSPFDVGDVQKVEVRVATNEAKVVNNRELPDISLQHMTAVMLLDKTVTFHSAHDRERMKDPAVLAVRAKITLIPDEELERRLPVREAQVEITLNDGRKLSEHVVNVRGTAENPMTREEVVTKARDLMTPVLGAGKCGQLIEKVLALETVMDIRELRPLLQRS